MAEAYICTEAKYGSRWVQGFGYRMAEAPSRGGRYMQAADTGWLSLGQAKKAQAGLPAWIPLSTVTGC